MSLPLVFMGKSVLTIALYFPPVRANSVFTKQKTRKSYARILFLHISHGVDPDNQYLISVSINICIKLLAKLPDRHYLFVLKLYTSSARRRVCYVRARFFVKNLLCMCLRAQTDSVYACVRTVYNRIIYTVRAINYRIKANCHL